MLDLSRFLFLDLEYNPATQRIREYGWEYNNKANHSTSPAALTELIQKSEFYVGHNIVRHDSKVLAEVLNITLDPLKILDTLLLSTLLFPHKPYHALRKEYLQDSEGPSDPAKDATLCRLLLEDCAKKWEEYPQWLQSLLYKFLHDKEGFSPFFALVPYAGKPNLTELEALFRETYENKMCLNGSIIEEWKNYPIEWSYLFTLFQTDEPSDYVPHWIRFQYPHIEFLLHRRRMNRCSDPECPYCKKELSTRNQLEKWFGYQEFRRFDPAEVIPLQQQVVEASFNNESILAIFPTGGGKSISFQLPALVAGKQLGALTVVISPLQSLMKDQVDVLQLRHNIDEAAYLNGLLTPLERKETLQALSEGQKSILYISPESLRSNTIFNLFVQRRIARFVIDEAHCFSSWGHDFRMDYLYLAEFLKDLQTKKNLPDPIPVSCFTATAKPAVIKDIEIYFSDRMKIFLKHFVSSVGRTNLSYGLTALETEAEKKVQLRLLLQNIPGPKIVYASTTKKTQELAEDLASRGFAARYYHGQMDNDVKMAIQDDFQNGKTEIIVATTAFGMGVDKDDVGLVVHYELSESLESYLQEAGRAGRNPKMQARCEVLFCPKDLNTHFQMLQYSRLTPNEIREVWNVISNTNKKTDKVVLSTLEIADRCGWTEREIHPRDLSTKVRQAILILEEAGFLERERNQNLIIGTSLGVESVEQARKILGTGIEVLNSVEATAFRIIRHLVTIRWTRQPECMMDELLVNLGLTREEALDGLRLLRAKRLLASRNDLSLKVIRNGNKTSRTVLDRTYTLQSLLLEHCKNAQVGKRFFLNLHDFNAKIQSVLGPSLFPRRDLAIFRGLLRYWKHRQVAEIELIEAGKQLYQIEFLSPPQEVRARTEGMWSGLQDSLNALLEIPDSPQGLIWFSLDDLVQKIHGDAGIKDPGAQHKTEMALLFLHSIGAIRLDRGLLVFYSAMVLHINQIQRNRRFSEDDFKKLEEHYENKAESIHIVGKYAELMQYAPRNAQEMVNDYFHMEIEDFRMKWMLGEKKTDAVSDELRMKIENSLNTEQQAVIRSRNKHILVAAGPGSGKTHLLVHKAASLLWMEKAKPESLLILTFTRAACVQLRKRLLDLAGDLAYSVRIATFHSFAFSILGMRGNLSESDKVVDHAATWLESDEAIEIGVPSVLMIDEYQDLSESEYHLLRAIYDLGEKTPRIIAVGDDDQSIYEFRGSSTRYFQKFTEDFPNAKVYNLTTNYRSLSGIVNTSATLLPLLKNRVKKEVSLHAYKTGKAELLFITAPYTTSYCCANWIARNISQWDTESVGVLSFHNIDLYRISAGLQEAHCTHQILRHSARDRFPLAQLREVIFFRKRLMNHPKVGSEPLTTEEFCAVLENSIQEFNTGNSWDIVRKMVNNYLSQEHEPTLYTWDSFVDEIKIQDLESTAITPITLCTMHASKGLEWDRVIICLDHWKPQSQQDWRTLYVACTRARKSLVIIGSMENLPPSWTKIFEQTLMREPARIPKQIEFELGMDDINLGHYLRKDDLCKKVQETLASTAGGNLFKVSPKYPTALTFGTLYMLWYSKKFQEKVLEPLEADGYKPLEAKLMHVCQWKESSSAEPYWIPLVKVKMRCDL